MALSLRGLKIIWMFVICVISCATILPMKIPQISKSEAVMSYLNCFAAGMFLSIAICHMLPESVEQHTEYATSHDIEKPFPTPYVCMYIGYMLILLVDKIIVPCLQRKAKTDEARKQSKLNKTNTISF